jgi:FkbM family methyltransferase
MRNHLPWASVSACYLLLSILFSTTTTTTAKLVSLLAHLKKTYPEWSPSIILDIGANKGSWSKAARGIYPKSKLLMVEASEQHITNLQATVDKLQNAEYRIAVLSGKDGDQVSFYINDGVNTGNSMFKEQTSFFDNVKPVQRTTMKLDTLVGNSTLLAREKSANNDDAVVDYIKVDVQGAELLVLQGGFETLKQASFVQFESSTVEYNAGSSCFFEIDEFLRRHGFYLYHQEDPMIQTLFKTRGLGQWDNLYVRPDSKRLPSFFKEEKGLNYCGSRADRITTTTASTSSNNVDKSKVFDRTADFTISDMFWEIWINGCFVGVVGTLFVMQILKWKSRRSKVGTKLW